MTKTRQKRGIFIAAAVLAVIAGLLLWQLYPKAKDKVEEAVLEQALSGKQEDIPNIIFKTFLLTQGEAGLEAWRLKAEVASVRKDLGIIYVEAPKITYFTRPDNEEVKVTAPKGMVDQAERNMELWPDVVVVKDKNTLKTTKMTYQGAKHTLFFPEAITVESEEILGKAAEGSWNLTDNIFEAWGGVSIHFKPKPRAQNVPADTPENQAAPAVNATQPPSAE